MKSLALKTSAFLENFLIQTLLYLVLLPLKFIYRAPQPTWNAWFANQRLCQIDGRYCWNSPGDQSTISTSSQRRIDMAPSAPQTTAHNNSSELLEHLMAEEISLQVQKIAEGLQREGWPMALVKRFMHVAVEDLPEWSLSKAPLTIKGLQSLKALQVFWLVTGSEGSCPRHLSFDLSEPHSDRDHSLKLREVSKVFAAGLTATIQKMCKVYWMSPIFRCLGCGQYIERSLATYKKHKGKIFCSTCNSRKQVESAADSKKT